MREPDDTFRLLYDHSLDAIFLADPAGAITAANPAACRLFGMSEEELRRAGRAGIVVADERLAAALEQPAATGRARAELTYVRKDGTRFVGDTTSVVIDPASPAPRSFVVVRDITELRRAAELIRQKSEELDRFFDVAIDLLCITDGDGRFVRVSRHWQTVFGYAPEELVGRSPLDFVHPDDIEATRAARARRDANGQLYNFVNRYRTSGGSYRWLEWHAVFDGKQTFAVARDITERRRADEALEASVRRARTIFDGAADPMLIHDAHGRILAANRAACRSLGYAREELLGLPIGVEGPVAPPPGGKHGLEVLEYRHKDGSRVPVEISATPIDFDGQPAVLSIARDVTERRRAEAEIVRLNRLYAAITHVNEAIIRVQSRDELFRQVCEVLTEFGGFEMAWVGITDPASSRVVPVACSGDRKKYLQRIVVMAADRPEGRGPVGTAIREDRTYVCNDFMRDPGTVPFRAAALDASWRAMLAVPLRLNARAVGALSVYSSEPHVFGQPEVALLEETAADVSFGVEAFDREVRRREAEEALREGERRFKGLIEAANEAIFVQTDHRFTYANDAALRLFGAERPEQLIGQLVIDRFHPAYREGISQRIRMVNEQRRAVGLLEQEALRLDGSAVTVEVSASPIQYEGRPGAVVFARNVTERKRLEEQLLHAQRMESVGRLAGGVAHDFNNMLSVIMGYAELRLSMTAQGDPARDDLLEILGAAQKSADLTRQLLAFARKQTIRPQVVDLNECIEGTLKMLERMIGEDIRLEWRPSGDLWPVKIDRSQVDQVLANLIVNSRDALPSGGTITIETCNEAFEGEFAGSHTAVAPGQYVRLAVSDTGEGMTPEVLRQVFDPFFTTKPTGRGTGLGLATVYGIVKQNGGFIDVYSEPDLGTTFKLWFPRHQAAGERLERTEVPETAPRGTETILLVEDAEPILRLGQTMLTMLGYTVLTAANATEAIERAAEYPAEIHLLVTDVIMPGMNGRDLYTRLRHLRPDVKCLYMSGYSADVIAHRGVLDESVRFVQKPFSLLTLAHGVREALDR